MGRRTLESVRALREPSFGDRLEAADNRRKLGALDDRSRHRQTNLSVRGLDGHGLQIRILEARLMRGTELPSRVSVPTVLRRIGLLSANLTNLSHGFLPEGSSELDSIA